MNIISRSSSVDEGAGYSIPGLESETARPDSGRRSFARDEPLQGEIFSVVSKHGYFMSKVVLPFVFNLNI